MLKEKYKANKFYKYTENKVGKIIEFGWVVAQPDEIELPAVLVYPAEDNTGTDEEKAKSLEEGISLTSLLDYRKYFNALVGSSADELLRIWNGKESEFIKYWISKQKNYTEEHAKFVLNIAELISGGKKFTQFSRTFKLI